jgi:BASS family bile acid:Na+ symporter
MPNSLLTDAVKVLIEALLFSNMLALALAHHPGELLPYWRRPGLLLRSLVVVVVLVPVVAYLVVSVVPGLSPEGRNAILLMAIASSAPFSLIKTEKVPTAAAFALALQLTVAILAVVTAPLGALLFFPADPHVTRLDVGLQVLRAQLAGLAVGLVIRYFWPAVADRLHAPVRALAGVLLALSAVGLLVLALPVALHLDFASVGAILVVIVASLALGQLLGGPRPDTRMVLAIVASQRNLGLALLLAGVLFERHLPTQVIILAYAILVQVVHIPYLRWQKRAAARRAAAAHPAAT